ncbi:hypothetical protein ACO0KY_19505, partial [Undibacterium sp. Dicai25W]|uniref:hypothetical protein n=1 Tax=Undibacterium sp. Dicai25W TaxID=3413034 RepID=UPI003BF3E385
LSGHVIKFLSFPCFEISPPQTLSSIRKYLVCVVSALKSNRVSILSKILLWFGQIALCNYFMNEIDLSDFNPKKIIANSAKTDVKSIGLPAIEKFILGSLSDDIFVDSLTNVIIEQNGDEKYELDSWELNSIKVNRNQLFLEFSENTKREKIEQTLLSRKLAEIFEFPANWKTSWKSGKNYYYKLPSKVQCMEMFAKYIKEKPEQLFPNYTDLKTKK